MFRQQSYEKTLKVVGQLSKTLANKDKSDFSQWESHFVSWFFGVRKPLGAQASRLRPAFIEPSVEPCFDQDSYGYRPNRSASDAIAKARERFHYTFDNWMRIHYPNIPFERYADDTIYVIV